MLVMKKNETRPEAEPMPKNKQELLHLIAQKGFEVGYAANLNFATHDIVDKVPVVISFVSMAVGILALVAPVFQLTCVAVCLTLLGILTLYIEKYQPHEYGERGKRTVVLLNRLEALYYHVKRTPDSSLILTPRRRPSWASWTNLQLPPAPARSSSRPGTPTTSSSQRRTTPGSTNSSTSASGATKSPPPSRYSWSSPPSPSSSPPSSTGPSGPPGSGSPAAVRPRPVVRSARPGPQEKAKPNSRTEIPGKSWKVPAHNRGPSRFPRPFLSGIAPFPTLSSVLPGPDRASSPTSQPRRFLRPSAPIPVVRDTNSFKFDLIIANPHTCGLAIICFRNNFCKFTTVYNNRMNLDLLEETRMIRNDEIHFPPLG